MRCTQRSEVLRIKNSYLLKKQKTMSIIKCITFDKKAQDNLPQHIKDKMKASRDKVNEERDSADSGDILSDSWLDKADNDYERNRDERM